MGATWNVEAVHRYVIAISRRYHLRIILTFGKGYHYAAVGPVPVSDDVASAGPNRESAASVEQSAPDREAPAIEAELELAKVLAQVSRIDVVKHPI